MLEAPKSRSLKLPTPSPFGAFQEIGAGVYWDGGVEAKGMADAGSEAVRRARSMAAPDDMSILDSEFPEGYSWGRGGPSLETYISIQHV